MPDAGDVAGGTMSGAAMGATVGSVVPGLGTAIGAGIGAIGGFITSLLSHGDDPQIKAQLDALYKRYGSLDPRIIAQREQVFQAQGDPQSRQLQMEALSSLKNQISQGGLDAIGRSQVAQSTQAGQQAAQQSANAIQERMRAQNASGQGTGSYVLQQQAGQNATNLGANQAMQAAAQAEQNRLGATNSLIQGAGQMGSLQQQLNQFNALAQQGVAQRYADRAQQAQQETFGNQMAQLGGQLDATTALDPESRRSQASQLATGGGLSQAAGAIGGYLAGGGGGSNAAAAGGVPAAASMQAQIPAGGYQLPQTFSSATAQPNAFTKAWNYGYQ